MSGYDLIVIGAGIIGSACAERAVAEGRRVAVIEAGMVGGGVTAASMGHLVAMDDDPAELALSHYSLGFWDAFESLSEAEFSRCGTLWVAEDEAGLARIPAKAARLKALGIETQVVDAEGLRELEPALADGLAGGLLVPREAVAYPPRMARWLIERGVAGGASLYCGRRALRLTGDGVELENGERLHGPVLVAAGLASADLLPELPMHARRGHLAITDRHPGVLRHQVLELGYADSVHGGAEASVAFNVQPRPTGQLLIGSSREQDRSGHDIHLPILQRMLERAFSFLPVLRTLQAIRVWTGARPCTTDGRPYIGAVPGRPGVWVATGHEGLGITTALGTAHLLNDLMDGRPAAIDAAPYDPARVLA